MNLPLHSDAKAILTAALRRDFGLALGESRALVDDVAAFYAEAVDHMLAKRMFPENELLLGLVLHRVIRAERQDLLEVLGQQLHQGADDPYSVGEYLAMQAIGNAHGVPGYRMSLDSAPKAVQERGRDSWGVSALRAVRDRGQPVNEHVEEAVDRFGKNDATLVGAIKRMGARFKKGIEEFGSTVESAKTRALNSLRKGFRDWTFNTIVAPIGEARHALAEWEHGRRDAKAARLEARAEALRAQAGRVRQEPTFFSRPTPGVSSAVVEPAAEQPVSSPAAAGRLPPMYAEPGPAVEEVFELYRRIVGNGDGILSEMPLLAVARVLSDMTASSVTPAQVGGILLRHADWHRDACKGFDLRGLTGGDVGLVNLTAEQRATVREACRANPVPDEQPAIAEPGTEHVTERAAHGEVPAPSDAPDQDAAPAPQDADVSASAVPAAVAVTEGSTQAEKAPEKPAEPPAKPKKKRLGLGGLGSMGSSDDDLAGVLEHQDALAVTAEDHAAIESCAEDAMACFTEKLVARQAEKNHQNGTALAL